MIRVICCLLAALCSCFRNRNDVHLEILALRHQVAVLQQAGRRPRLRPVDRWLWIVLYRVWNSWRDSLHIVKPATVVGWHRAAFNWGMGQDPPLVFKNPTKGIQTDTTAEKQAKRKRYLTTEEIDRMLS